MILVCGYKYHQTCIGMDIYVLLAYFFCFHEIVFIPIFFLSTLWLLLLCVSSAALSICLSISKTSNCLLLFGEKSPRSLAFLHISCSAALTVLFLDYQFMDIYVANRLGDNYSVTLWRGGQLYLLFSTAKIMFPLGTKIGQICKKFIIKDTDFLGSGFFGCNTGIVSFLLWAKISNLHSVKEERLVVSVYTWLARRHEQDGRGAFLGSQEAKRREELGTRAPPSRSLFQGPVPNQAPPPNSKFP